MKKSYIIIAAAMFASFDVHAQQSMRDQIEAVDDVQKQSEAAQRAAQQEHQRRWEAQQQAEMAAQQQRQVTMEAVQKQKEAMAAEDKKREQEYEDKLRALDLQQKSLQIEAEKARVARSNDYIDQELKAKAAETDVVKSQADSQRNISEGTKTLMEKTGDAEVKKESGIFSR